MEQSRLKDSGFVDLIIGEDYAEVKGMIGASSLLAPAPGNLIDDIQKLRIACLAELNKRSSGEFSVKYDGLIYRVTATSNYGAPELVVRQTQRKLLVLDSLPMNSDLKRSFAETKRNGLVLVSGAMASGKTTTAASIFSNRLSLTGSVGVSIEDPIETILAGVHGTGRCLQLEVGDNLTYASAVKKAYRMTATSFLIGEIRDAETAREVLKASLSMFVVSTIHASSITDAIERYVMFCEEFNPNARANIANTLYIVTHQRMKQRFSDGGMVVGNDVEISGFNIMASNSRDPVRSKIKAGEFQAIKDHLDKPQYNFI